VNIIKKNTNIIILFGIFVVTIATALTNTESTCPVPSTPGNLSCTVTKIIDGDTVHAQCGGIDTKIRLTVIDSYESKKNTRAFKQAYEQKITVEEVVIRGKQATEYTKQELADKQILVVPPAKSQIDRYGRTLGTIYFNCVDINQKLLTEHPDVFLRY
jgi:micrococcal nuclease